MSPISPIGVSIVRMLPWKHGIVEVQQSHFTGTYMACCAAIVYDEDDVARRCGWTGPDRDHLEIAVDDALWHHHEEEGACGRCMPCQKRLGMWENP